MNLKDAIKIRKSRRKYIEKKIDEPLVHKLQNSITKYNNLSKLNIQLITNNGKAFEGFTKTYGFFNGVKNYIAIIGTKHDKNRLEKEGYFGEKLVLEATSYGLGSCWVGLNYDKKLCACNLSDDEIIDYVITLGYCNKELSFKEKIIKSIAHVNNQQMGKIIDTKNKSNNIIKPKWFYECMKAVHQAPTAMNARPFLFSCNNNIISAICTSTSEKALVDLGIAKLHFEIAYGNGQWEWGSPANFNHTNKVK